MEGRKPLSQIIEQPDATANDSLSQDIILKRTVNKRTVNKFKMLFTTKIETCMVVN